VRDGKHHMRKPRLEMEVNSRGYATQTYPQERQFWGGRGVRERARLGEIGTAQFC
jgi:hypothetical protein